MFDSFLYLIIVADLLVNLLTTKFPYFFIHLFIFLKNGCKTNKEKQTRKRKKVHVLLFLALRNTDCHML